MVAKRRRVAGSAPQVTIIIVTHNFEELTLECIRAVKNYTQAINYELIVVDNGSFDSSFKRLKSGVGKLDIEVKFLRFSRNLGFSYANNAAARAASGKYLVFLNNDVVVTANWLTPILKFMDKNSDVACCQPKLHSYIEKDYFDYTGAAGGFLDIFGYPFCRGRVFDHIERDVGQYDDAREVTWASGACFVIRRDVFKSVGGFDEYYFAYMEEIDLCVRLRREGYRVFCLPESQVFHWGAYTSNLNLYWKIFNNHHNNLYFVLKNYSLWPYFPLILTRFMFDVLAIFYYMATGHFSFVLAVGGAYVKLAANIPRLVRHNIVTLRGKSLLTIPTVYRGSVVISYFLLSRIFFGAIFGEAGANLVREYKTYREITYFR